MGDGGLMYRRNRYYDPNTGQFTQEDPLGLAGGMNAYGFAAGDPINHNDPLGTDCPPGKAIAICVLVSVINGLKAGPTPFSQPTTIEPAPSTATRPVFDPPEGTGEMKEFAKDAMDAYKRLVGDPEESFGAGTDPNKATILRKIIEAGGSDDAAAGAAKGLAAGSARVVGGLVGLVAAHLIHPPALGNSCSDADAQQHKCVAQ